MRTFIFAALVLSSTLAFAGRLEEVYNPEMSYEQSYKNAKVEKAIKRALLQRGWSVKDQKSGKITAKLVLRAHRATVDIHYGSGKINFKYIDSVALKAKQKKGKQMIHRNYNRWIMNLEKDINIFLMD